MKYPLLPTDENLISLVKSFGTLGETASSDVILKHAKDLAAKGYDKLLIAFVMVLLNGYSAAVDFISRYLDEIDLDIEIFPHLSLFKCLVLIWLEKECDDDTQIELIDILRSWLYDHVLNKFEEQFADLLSE